MTMSLKSLEIFQFVRGAIRGAYGIEDFRGKRFLIKGVGDIQKQLMLSIAHTPEVILYFTTNESSSMEEYFTALRLGPTMKYWEGQEIDVEINLIDGYLTVRGTTFHLENIGEDPYTQGIHEFYPLPY